MYTSTTQQNVMSLRGLSTDTKPVNQAWLENGSTFLEMDTSKVFVYDGEHKEWIEQTDGGEGGDIVIDDAISSTSENPVQNKVIYGALQNKADIVNGKVPEAQLPSYVDDVIEGYYYNGAFYEEDTHTTEITGESGKIYVDLSTDDTYRWSGSAFVKVGPEGQIVVANPTLAGTEAELTGLQVGDVKYKVPGGGHLYEHMYEIQYGNHHSIWLSLLKNDTVPLSSIKNIKEYLAIQYGNQYNNEIMNNIKGLNIGINTFRNYASPLLTTNQIPLFLRDAFITDNAIYLRYQYYDLSDNSSGFTDIQFTTLDNNYFGYRQIL